MILIIVESPTKARTFTRLLDKKKYTIEATMGHIRDLPSKKIGIDVKNNFQPEYILVDTKAKVIKQIKRASKKANDIILATDADREGEAIAYHTAYILGYVTEKWPKFSRGKKKLKRIVFHEITRQAINKALNNPSTLNLDLVQAQQGRRLLDRIVGYNLSPLLWKKLGKRWLSAGRVQTIALRFIVEREKEIKGFKSTSYYRITGLFSHKRNTYEATLTSHKGKGFFRKNTIRLFDGSYTYSSTTIDKNLSEKIRKDLKSDLFKIKNVQKKISPKSPPPPFITSTLQQTASRLFRYSSKMTMSLAQSLYEKGFITYHRTDSSSLSSQFVKSATNYAAKIYGSEYVVDKQRVYKTKSKLAQEAHEAIRPTKISTDIERSTKLTPRHKKLYGLIKNRALSCMMKDAQIANYKIIIESELKYLFESRYEHIEFDGFLRVYNKKKETVAPILPKEETPVELDNLELCKQQTKPPPRYSEASLIKTLEEKGIGRPSTYAPTISRILDRNYVEKREGRLDPSFLGTTVSDYLSSAFPDILQVNFTAKMEDQLDSVAQGNLNFIKLLTDFYSPFIKLIEKQKKIKKYIDVEEKTDQTCPECKNKMVIRYSKFGKFFACSNYPKCKFTKSFIEKVDKKCPECGGDVIVRFTKKRKRFYGCSNYPKCTFSVWRISQIDKYNK